MLLQHLFIFVKGIVDFKIHFDMFYGIQDVGVFVCSIFNFDIFQSNRCCLSVIHWRLKGYTKEHA